jgi:glyoxylate/hydroxypyruvate reductase A
MSILLNLTGWDPAPWLARFGALLPGHEIVTLDRLVDRAAVRYALVWKHPPGSLVGLRNLRAIFSLGAGVDHIFADPKLPDVPIARVVGGDLAQRMGEWVALHCLMHLRQTRRYERQQQERVWAPDFSEPAASEVRVGFEVAGWSASPKTEPGVACFYGPDGLDAMLARTDILVALLPLTPATRGILNAGLFAKLARGGRLGGPVLLNAGRGGLQVEADILAALDSGALKGASLDVFETEPPPADSRLWTHPAVVLSPHNAAISSPDATARAIAEQILAHERGQPLRHLVDRAKGY